MSILYCLLVLDGTEKAYLKNESVFFDSNMDVMTETRNFLSHRYQIINIEPGSVIMRYDLLCTLLTAEELRREIRRAKRGYVLYTSRNILHYKSNMSSPSRRREYIYAIRLQRGKCTFLGRRIANRPASFLPKRWNPWKKCWRKRPSTLAAT